MLKWIYKIIATGLIGLGLFLDGCAVQQNAANGSSDAAATSAAYPASGTNAAYPDSNDAGSTANGQPGLPLSKQLALGTLNLEGTDLAVTPEQAATLLPLWQAADASMVSGNASAADQQAAFQQIQAAMTAGQMRAIQSMDLSGQNMLDLAQKLGIEMPGGQASGQPPQGTPGPGGPPSAQGTPMPGGPQGMAANGTPAAPPGMRGGFETAFYQAVIDPLQQKSQ
ncbi:MAG: hypothetical protein P8Z00_00460 [Anaerolineales bacterium]